METCEVRDTGSSRVSIVAITVPNCFSNWKRLGRFIQIGKCRLKIQAILWGTWNINARVSICNCCHFYSSRTKIPEFLADRIDCFLAHGCLQNYCYFCWRYETAVNFDGAFLMVTDAVCWMMVEECGFVLRKCSAMCSRPAKIYEFCSMARVQYWKQFLLDF